MATCASMRDCPSHFMRDAWVELKGQPFRDDPFSERDWQFHTTWRRYIPEPHISGVVIISLAPVWLWSVVVAMLVGLYATYAEPAGWPDITHQASLLPLFTLTNFALSLLMLFKTNSSYSRWWECRTLWGSGYITVRSVLRTCFSFVGRDHPELLPPLYRWTAAVLPALATHLRGKMHYMDDHLAAVLHPAELAWLRARAGGAGIAPVAALQVLSRLLDRAAGLHPIERQQVEALLSQLDVVIGGCERIRSQPIPYAWNRHTHRFLLCWLSFMPFVLWQLYQWVSLPITGVVSFLLVGIENVGVQLEEPNRVLPLNAICAGTCRALRLMVADADASADAAALAAGLPPLPPESGAVGCAVEVPQQQSMPDKAGAEVWAAAATSGGSNGVPADGPARPGIAGALATEGSRSGYRMTGRGDHATGAAPWLGQ